MKKLLIAVLSILLLVFVSCSDFKTSDYSPFEKIAPLTQNEVLADTIVFEPSTNPIDEYFDYYLGMESIPEGVNDYVYFTSASTAVSEVGIFKVSDAQTAQALLDAFEARGENLASIFVNYSPEDTAIAENIQTGSFDDIVWFVATSDNDSVISIIRE